MAIHSMVCAKLTEKAVQSCFITSCFSIAAPSFDSHSGVVSVQEELQAISAWIYILCLWVAMGQAASQKQNLSSSFVNCVS